MRLYTFKLEELDTKVRALNNMRMEEYIEYSLAAKKFYMNFNFKSQRHMLSSAFECEAHKKKTLRLKIERFASGEKTF